MKTIKYHLSQWAIVGMLLAGVCQGEDLLTAPAYDLGIQGGVNIGSTSGTGAASSARAMFGVFTEPAIGRLLYLQAEINYMGQGPGLSYLTVPLLLKYKFLQEDSPVRPFMGFGPEFAIKLEGVGAKAAAFGIDFMGGIHYVLDPSFSFYVAGRYTLGITNLVSTPGANAKMRNFQILAGILIAT